VAVAELSAHVSINIVVSTDLTVQQVFSVFRSIRHSSESDFSFGGNQARPCLRLRLGAFICVPAGPSSSCAPFAWAIEYRLQLPLGILGILAVLLVAATSKLKHGHRPPCPCVPQI